MAGMVWWQEQEASWSHYICVQQIGIRKWGQVIKHQGPPLELSIFQLGSTSGRFLSLPNRCHQLDAKYLNIWGYEGTFHIQTTTWHEGNSDEKVFVWFMPWCCDNSNLNGPVSSERLSSILQVGYLLRKSEAFSSSWNQQITQVG